MRTIEHAVYFDLLHADDGYVTVQAYCETCEWEGAVWNEAYDIAVEGMTFAIRAAQQNAADEAEGHTEVTLLHKHF